MARPNRVVGASETIRRTVCDVRGLRVSTWIGTNDAGATDADRRDTTSGGNLISRSEILFDDRGRTYRTIRYEVDPATGTIGESTRRTRLATSDQVPCPN